MKDLGLILKTFLEENITEEVQLLNQLETENEYVFLEVDNYEFEEEETLYQDFTDDELVLYPITFTIFKKTIDDGLDLSKTIIKLMINSQGKMLDDIYIDDVKIKSNIKPIGFDSKGREVINFSLEFRTLNK